MGLSEFGREHRLLFGQSKTPKEQSGAVISSGMLGRGGRCKILLCHILQSPKLIRWSQSSSDHVGFDVYPPTVTEL